MTSDVTGYENDVGMNARDVIAMHIAAAMNQNPRYDNETYDAVARKAYDQADALIEKSKT